MDKWFRIGLLGLALASLAGLAGCHRTPDEERIRQAIAAASQAVEHADASALGGLLSDDFDGNGREADKRQLVGVLRIARLRGETLHALVGPIQVEARGDRYIARFSVTLTRGDKLLPAQVDIYDVESAWRRDGATWICFSATWKT
jgi:hypothetical protein